MSPSTFQRRCYGPSIPLVKIDGLLFDAVTPSPTLFLHDNLCLLTLLAVSLDFTSPDAPRGFCSIAPFPKSRLPPFVGFFGFLCLSRTVFDIAKPFFAARTWADLSQASVHLPELPQQRRFLSESYCHHPSQEVW